MFLENSCEQQRVRSMKAIEKEYQKKKIVWILLRKTIFVDRLINLDKSTKTIWQTKSNKVQS